MEFLDRLAGYNLKDQAGGIHGKDQLQMEKIQGNRLLFIGIAMLTLLCGGAICLAVSLPTGALALRRAARLNDTSAAAPTGTQALTTLPTGQPNTGIDRFLDPNPQPDNDDDFNTADGFGTVCFPHSPAGGSGA